MKKIFLILLAIALAAAACPAAGADGPALPRIVTSGDYSYSVHDDTAVIEKYNGDRKAVKIPSEIDGYTVTKVGAEAFRYRKLKSVSFPDSIVSIGKQAFEYCEITDTLRLPENVTISSRAFSYAVLPAALVIPAGTTIEECAFSYCETIERAVIGPGSVLGSRAFSYCDDLELAVLGDGCHLMENAFEFCRDMKRAYLCGDVQTDEGAFYRCGDYEVTKTKAGEYRALKQSAVDGTLGRRAVPAPAEPEERVLEIISSPAESKGVTVTLEKATAVKNTKPEGFTYAFSGTLENNSDEGIMQVIYTFALIDENGEEFRSFGEVFDGEDTALPPHTKISFTHDGIKWGKQSVPAAVKIGVSSVKTETELPPAHIPKPGEDLYQALGDERLANILNEKPAELSFHIDQGGYGRTAVFKAGDDGFDKAVALFCAIRIGEESGEWVTDNYNWISIRWEDGSYSGVSLNMHNLEYTIHSSIHTYTLENLGPFWSYCTGYLQED